MRWTVALVGCTSKDSDGSFVVPDNDTGDADTDTDTDSDTDTDADTDLPAGPCPFEGEWTIASGVCSGGDLELTGTTSIDGTAASCLLRFEGVSHSGCSVVEQVELLSRPFGLWEGYSDGAPDSEGCLVRPAGAQILGSVGVEILPGGDLELTHSGGDEVGLRIVDPCAGELELLLTPGA